MSNGRALAGKKILVVEDEYAVATLLRDALEDQGAVVLGPVPAVAPALALIDAAPDAAVLDINLQSELAFPIADALADAGVPFLFNTGYGADDLPARYAHVVRLQKPVAIPRLVAQLKALLRHA